MKRPLLFSAALLVTALSLHAADGQPALELSGRINSTGTPAPEPKFQDLTIDDKVQIGYGVAVADVDGDKLPDILLADKKQYAWYRNPGPAKAADPTAWTKYIIADGITPKDNVCIAAQDIDGDGKCEIAVGAEWNPGDTVNSGAVFYLIPPKDRLDPTAQWTPVKLQHEPTTHRMKWVKNRDGRWVLVVLPLHGRGNVKGEGAGVKILAYTPPAKLNDPQGVWKTEVVNPRAELHSTHNFDLILDNQGLPSRGIYVASKEGLFAFMTPLAFDARPIIHDLDEGEAWGALLAPVDGTVPPIKGMGEIRRCAREGYYFSLVAVEPMHGNELVDYLPVRVGGKVSFERRVLTDKLSEGHALACGDLLGQQFSQVVIGSRGNPTNPNPENVGIKIFTPSNANHDGWRETVVDNKIACEDLVLADLNGDGKLDIVGAGRATHNLKIYLNQTPAMNVAKVKLPPGATLKLRLVPATGYSSPGLEPPVK